MSVTFCVLRSEIHEEPLIAKLQSSVAKQFSKAAWVRSEVNSAPELSVCTSNQRRWPRACLWSKCRDRTCGTSIDGDVGLESGEVVDLANKLDKFTDPVDGQDADKIDVRRTSHARIVLRGFEVEHDSAGRATQEPKRHAFVVLSRRSLHIAVFTIHLRGRVAIVRLRPAVDRGLDRDLRLRMHSRFGADAATEASLIGEEAVADDRDSVDHGLASIFRVRFRDSSNVQGDEGLDPKRDDHVGIGRCRWCWSAHTALDIVRARASASHEGSRAWRSRIVQACTGLAARTGARFGDAAFDIRRVIGTIVVDSKS